MRGKKDKKIKKRSVIDSNEMLKITYLFGYI